MLRIALRGLAALLLIALLAVTGALGWRAWRQHEIAPSLAIKAPPGIDEQRFARIGGIDQWISIRGDDTANPVVLILHGGPGSALSPVSPVFRSWERRFTVVLWDQRGAGRTFGRNGDDEGPMNVERMVADGVEVAEYLRARTGQPRIVLVGVSWGSELGLLMVKRRPDLFSAYVGAGQVVAKEEKEEILYARLMTRLQATRDDEAIARLQKLGPPPYPSEAALDIQRSLQNRFEVEAERGQSSAMAQVALTAPGNSLKDIWDYPRGQSYAGEALYRELLGFDARKLGFDYAVPMFVIEGEADLTTPPDLARAWFESLTAPQKDFLLIPGAGHSAILTHTDAFLRELDARVRPLALRAAAPQLANPPPPSPPLTPATLPHSPKN